MQTAEQSSGATSIAASATAAPAATIWPEREDLFRKEIIGGIKEATANLKSSVPGEGDVRRVGTT